MGSLIWTPEVLYFGLLCEIWAVHNEHHVHASWVVRKCAWYSATIRLSLSCNCWETSWCEKSFKIERKWFFCFSFTSLWVFVTMWPTGAELWIVRFETCAIFACVWLGKLYSWSGTLAEYVLYHCYGSFSWHFEAHKEAIIFFLSSIHASKWMTKTVHMWCSCLFNHIILLKMFLHEVIIEGGF